jgi:hypothetical protein
MPAFYFNDCAFYLNLKFKKNDCKKYNLPSSISNEVGFNYFEREIKREDEDHLTVGRGC